MDRIDETDEEVDLRPRRPELRRLYDEDRGVRGDGESDTRRFDEDAPPVLIAGRNVPELARETSGRTCELEYL
jgi:hypothetical protein